MATKRKAVIQDTEILAIFIDSSTQSDQFVCDSESSDSELPNAERSTKLKALLQSLNELCSSTNVEKTKKAIKNELLRINNIISLGLTISCKGSEEFDHIGQDTDKEDTEYEETTDDENKKMDNLKTRRKVSHISANRRFTRSFTEVAGKLKRWLCKRNLDSPPQNLYPRPAVPKLFKSRSTFQKRNSSRSTIVALMPKSQSCLTDVTSSSTKLNLGKILATTASPTGVNRRTAVLFTRKAAAAFKRPEAVDTPIAIARARGPRFEQQVQIFNRLKFSILTSNAIVQQDPKKYLAYQDGGIINFEPIREADKTTREVRMFLEHPQSNWIIFKLRAGQSTVNTKTLLSARTDLRMQTVSCLFLLGEARLEADVEPRPFSWIQVEP
uniref:Uncharacterized protein n=1 Tax=Timema tahoe TaxID=61484 RepID=A0A7R9FP03_9NEOP|nr:unnamed protein product [Timema tahoe]